MSLPDIQRTLDGRGVAINSVGVTGIRMPIRIKRQPHDTAGQTPHCDTVGEFELAVSLPMAVKGTHMSRFTQVLMEFIDTEGVFSSTGLITLAQAIAKRLESKDVTVRVRLDYFMLQNAPATSALGVAPMKGFLECRLLDGAPFCRTGIEVEGKTCCPCSKEISDYDHGTGRGKGAHAQRSRINIEVKHLPGVTVWFESLVHIAWRAFSQPVYPVLKRPDERHVTMGAYNNPKFVEDVIRDVVLQLRQYPLVGGFRVRVQNAESIHYHDAFAEVEEEGYSHA